MNLITPTVSIFDKVQCIFKRHFEVLKILSTYAVDDMGIFIYSIELIYNNQRFARTQ
jgi:hypothetical protein